MNRIEPIWILVGLACALMLPGCDSKRPEAAAAPTDELGAKATSGAPAQTPDASSFNEYREAATNPEDKRLVVLLHGYGADERDLVPAARAVGLEGPIVSLRAPKSAGRGYAWFPIDFDAEPRYSPDAADSVLPRLAAHLRELDEEFPEHDVLVMGFSQGAMLTMMLAVEHPDALDHAVALSGALPRPVRTPADWNAETAPVLLAVHGKADRVIPLERARQAQKWLEEAGAEPTYMEYDGMGHTIGRPLINDLRNYLGK